MVTFTFEDPETEQITVLELRNPQMGNTDTFEFTRISRSSKGGDTIIFRDELWPVVEKLTLQFEIISKKKPGDDTCEFEVDEIKNFIRKTLGKEIAYTDQNEDDWIVLISNPNSAIQQKNRSTYTLNLELEAERV